MKQKLLVQKLIFSSLWLHRRLASHCILSFWGNVFPGFVYSLLFKLVYSHDASRCPEHPLSRSWQNPSPLAFPPSQEKWTLRFWWCGLEVEKNDRSCLHSGLGDFRPNALRSRSGVNDSLSSTSSRYLPTHLWKMIFYKLVTIYYYYYFPILKNWYYFCPYGSSIHTTTFNFLWCQKSGFFYILANISWILT